MHGLAISAETVARHREWSVKNFGDRNERGPVGPLKHLSKEALEAAEAPSDIMEFADCMFLMLDAMYRAGHTSEDLDRAMAAKMVVLETRVYRKVAGDVPIEHDRSLDEKIDCAAILADDGIPFYLPRPARHHDIIRAMADNGHKTPITGEQGFMTTERRFVDRKEGLLIAIKAGQIVKKHGNDTILFSEDLW